MKGLRLMGMSLLGASALGFVGHADAALLCKNTSTGVVAVRDVCLSTETNIDPATIGAGAQPAYTATVSSIDIPSSGWNFLSPVASVFIPQPGRYVIVATASVRAVNNGDYVQCDLYTRGASRGRAISVVSGQWTGESIAVSAVDTLTVAGNAELRCTDIDATTDSMLTNVRITAMRVQETYAPAPTFDLEASCFGYVKNIGASASPATTAYFPTCKFTYNIPALAAGGTYKIPYASGCDSFLIDPQGLLNQNRTNDSTVGQACIN